MMVKVPASYKDPSGYLFFENGQLFRKVNDRYRDTYNHVKESGIFQELMEKGLLIPHEEIGESLIKPRMIPFISYPYEWGFSELQDAALLTLEIQRIAISHGFTLKDAHGFNIQFDVGKPILIDTLSFDRWNNTPWVAYRQFCESFLIPLALMSQDLRLNGLLAKFLGGVPLEIGSKLLPARTWLSMPLLMHIHLHANRDAKSNGATIPSNSSQKFSRSAMLGLCMSLENAVHSIKTPKGGTVWDNYYQDSCIYTDAGFDQKKKFVASICQEQRPASVWDLGCNTGEFSDVASKYSNLVVAIDSDPMCIERLYQHCKKEQINNILPLQMDLTNPSAGVGWELQERSSIFERGGCDVALALALVHHLCIAANVPLDYVAHFMGRIAKKVIIEFVPKGDPQVQLLLSSREDIFTDYNQDAFEEAFKGHFVIASSEKLANSDRTLYYMEHL